jgi:hypothetical protein
MRRRNIFAGITALAIVPPILVALLGRWADRQLDRILRRPR